MPFPTAASVPPDVRRRFSGRCLEVWREVWNSTYDRDRDEGRAFATAETAAQRCKAAKAEENTVDMAVKFTDEASSEIRGLAIPFGGHIKGKDVHGQDFGPDTDLCLDWFPERPILYHHGLHGAVKSEKVGTQTAVEVEDGGAFVRAELDKRNRWYGRIKELVDKDALSFSSGAYPHLVETRKDGRITRWPWVETSLTPTPANALAVVYAVKADTASIFDTTEEDGPADGPYTEHGQRVLADIGSFLERTDDRAAARIKVGRELSSANREALRELDGHLAEWAQGIAEKRARIMELLDRTDPDAKKAIEELEIELLVSELRRAGVSV